MTTTFLIPESSWARSTARWALAAALAGVALFFAFPIALPFDPSVPQEYATLVQASQRPGGFRMVASLDLAVYLLNAMLFGTLAGLFAGRAALRAGVLGLAAVGFVVSAVGAQIWLNATEQLAPRYATIGAGASEIVTIYAVVMQIVQAHFNLGAAVLGGIGFLVVASGAGLVGIPRWLAAWLAVSGAWSLGTRAFSMATGTEMPFFPAGLLYTVVGVIALQLALAAVLWRGGASR